MAEKIVPDPEFESVLRHIQETRGLDFRGYKRTSLRRRIALRMEAVGVEDFASYRAHLEAQPSEFEDLLNTVLINVTSFFRDEEAWRVLEAQVIPALVERAQDDRGLRVWSIGCASGEEPYSLAMLLAERMGVSNFCRQVKIYATDLDEEALKTARMATYSPRDVENVPPEMLERYFDRTNNHYVFERELRKCVIFGRHNVVHDAPISRIDLIICRNLLIYLESDTQAVVLPRLHYALSEEGFLFLGKAETQLARSALFRPVEMKHRIFAKVTQEWRRTMGSNFSGARGTRIVPAAGDAQLLEAILNEAGTALLVVDDEGAVAFANSPARLLLGIGEGDIGRPFQDLPVSYRPIELRGPIDEALRQRRSVRLDNQEYRLTQSEVLRLNIDVRPLLRPNGSVHAALLSFSDQTRLHSVQRELEAAQENLEQSIEELQSSNEELETTNEELQSTNEELETTNEELQSINEELETLNEEARSSNEEMEAVNEELRIQAEQASGYRLHLESVLRAMNGGIIVLNDKRIVQSWNRWSENTWGLRAEEVLGTAFDALDVGFPTQLLGESLTAVQQGHKEQAEKLVEGIDRRGRSILCQIRISALLDENGIPHGLVLVFQDITSQRHLEDYGRYLGRIMGRALNEIYFLDPVTLRFLLTNNGAQRKLGYSVDQLTQMTLLDILVDIGAEDVRALISPLLANTQQKSVFEATIRSQDGRTHRAQICLEHFSEEAPPILVATVHEIGTRRPPADHD